MEKRFESKAEAGGEQGQDKSDKRSWSERFLERIKRESKQAREKDEPAEKQVSFSEFIRGLFAKEEQTEEPELSSNIVDRVMDESQAEAVLSDEEKLAQLDDDEKVYFYAVVAQRFKDAGERFIGFIRRSSNQPELVAESSTGPEITDVEAMYQASDIEAEPTPQEDAPPFDFAVQTREEEELYEDTESLDDETIIVSEVGVVDDFDYPAGYGGGERNIPTVSKDGDVTTIYYKPRLRDVVFATSVGKPEARSEYKKAKTKLDKEKKKNKRQHQELVDAQAKKFMAEQEILRQQHANNRVVKDELDFKERELDEREKALDTQERDVDQRSETPKPQYPEVMGTVRQATEELFSSPSSSSEIPRDLQADPAAAAERLAKAEAAPIEELEFQNLKPAAKRIETRTSVVTPDSVAVKVSEEVPKPKPEVKESTKEEKDYLATGEAAREENAEVKVPQPRLSEAVSVNEILANRTQIPGEKKSIKQHVSNQYNIETKRGAGSWVATAVIVSLLLIGLLFISAV